MASLKLSSQSHRTSLWKALQATRAYSQKTPPLPTPPKIPALTTPEDTHEARAWLASFRGSKIPKEAVHLGFSRSSGPGGQARILLFASILRARHAETQKYSKHVNKTNSKATLRCSVDASWIPPWAHPELRRNVSLTIYFHAMYTDEQHSTVSHTTCPLPTRSS